MATPHPSLVTVRVSRALLWALTVTALAHPLHPVHAQQTQPWADSLYALIRADMERLATLQRDHYTLHQSFATDLGTLHCDASRGVTLTLLVSRQGYATVGQHGSLGPLFGCVLYHGDAPSPSIPLTASAPDQVECTTGAPELPFLLEGEDPLATPVTIPHDRNPEMKNSSYIADLLASEYPAELLGRGIGGKVDMLLYICEKGTVRAAVLEQSSGYDRMDKFALQVAQRMKFDPARSQGHPVGVWMKLPITFRPR